MIPETYVGNPDLEAEWLASQLLDGLVLPADYTALRINLANIPMVDVSESLTEKLLELQDETVSKFGLLEDKPVKDFYFGEAPELYKLIVAIYKETVEQAKLYLVAAEEQFAYIEESIDQYSATMDYYELADGVSKSQLDMDKAQQYNDQSIKLRQMRGTLETVLTSYGVGEGKLPTKKVVTPGLTPKYKLYLQTLSTNLDEAVSNMKLAFTIAKALDGIISLIPKDDLDPYLSDVCVNFIDVVTDPKSYYTKCKNDEIVSSSVATLFGNCYPEFYNKYQDMYMDDYANMDNQEQIEFRKCFGLDSDDSELTSLCSKYVKLGFTQS